MQSKTIRYSSKKGGFTLVEILIVVIILGILAAIVIPQFTNASQDARKSSVASLLQTIRSQVELYKVQHGDVLPNLATGPWTDLTAVSHYPAGSTTTPPLGPYLQSAPLNPLNSSSNVSSGDLSGTFAAPAGHGFGWVFDYGTDGHGTGKIWATNQTDTALYDESGATQPQIN